MRSLAPQNRSRGRDPREGQAGGGGAVEGPGGHGCQRGRKLPENQRGGVQENRTKTTATRRHTATVHLFAERASSMAYGTVAPCHLPRREPHLVARRWWSTYNPENPAPTMTASKSVVGSTPASRWFSCVLDTTSSSWSCSERTISAPHPARTGRLRAATSRFRANSNHPGVKQSPVCPSHRSPDLPPVPSIANSITSSK